MDGWWNHIACVDLSTGTITCGTIDETIYHDYLGGRGLGARLLIDEIAPTADAFTENALIFAAGPLTGTPVPTAGRFSATAKSPLTGTICDANVGGSFGQAFKKTGLDALIVTGSAQEPSVIYINDGDVTIEKTELWGATTTDTCGGLPGRTAAIGPAGEHLVRYACIATDGHRVFGRGGLGAVMGSKQLKAITVQGSASVPVADRARLKGYVEKAGVKLASSPVTSRGLRQFGTPILVNLINWLGMLPARNFQRPADERADALSGETMADSIVQSHEGCYACPIRCGLHTAVGEGNEREQGKGPEYESVWALGPNLGIYDLGAITRAGYRCNDLGLDTISTGGTLAAGMEMRQHGTWDDLPGFGDTAALAYIDDIAHRRGVGDQLAEGSARLCQAYGCSVSMSVKGMELPAYDPRGAAGQALSFATSNRGGCHLRGYMIGEEIFGVPKLFDRFKTGGKPEVVRRSQERNAYLDSLILCKFTAFALDEQFYPRFLEAVTGRTYSVADLHTIGRRIYTLEREFNTAAGFTRDDDRLPERFSEPLETGASAGSTFDMNPMLDVYYAAMGWDIQGRPTDETLEKLGVPRLR
ncbi:MAG: aldehyde ferredoxin oxidoreductase family protein [Thermoplasmatota archaeon]